jgi:hypothetical protein
VPPFLKKKSISSRENSHFEANEDKNLNVDEGNSIDLNCGAFGKPEPVVKWYSFKYKDSNSVYLKCKIFKLVVNY